MSDRDELAKEIRVGFFGMTDGDLDEEDRQMADAVLRSDWLARVKREAAADALDAAGADAFLYGRPNGDQLRMRAREYREQVK